FGVELAQVAGAQPAFFAERRTQLASLPVSAGDVFSAHQDLARFGIELYLAAGQYLADRTLAHAEGVVEADQRCGLGHAISLDDHEAESTPELFGVFIERGAAGDHRPEFPAELVVHATEAPPAPPEVLAFGLLELCLKPFLASRRFEVADDLLFKA